MANALLLNKIATGNDADQYHQQQFENQLTRQNQEQRNTLFQQQQADYQREQKLMGVRNDLAAYIIARKQGPQAAQQAWSQIAPKYGAQDQDPEAFVPDFIQKNPGILGKASEAVLADFLASRPAIEVSPGATLVDPRTNKPLYTAPNRPDAQTSRLVAMPDADSPSGFSYGIPKPGDAAAPPRSTPRLPPQIQKAEDEDLEAINLATGIDKDLGSLVAQIQGGGIELGPVQNVVSGVRNWAGASNENSRNFASLKSSLEKLRNDSLRLNKGVQTEGDAVRAWNEILASINDPQLVMQRLGEVQLINQRAVELRQRLIKNRRRSYGSQAPETQQFEAQTPTVGAQKPQAGGGGFRVIRRKQ